MTQWRMPNESTLRAVYEPFDADRFAEAGYQLEEDDDPLSMTRETIREQRGQFETLLMIEEVLRSNRHPGHGGELTPKQRKSLEDELPDQRDVYAGIYVSYESAFGDEAAEKLKAIVEKNPPDFCLRPQLDLFERFTNETNENRV